MTTASAVTRTVDGHEVPIAGTWKIDPGHALVGFLGRHFMLTKVRGRFTSVSGSVVVAENPHESKVSVAIDMTSINSGDDTRDNHLKSEDFFDIEKFPTASFVSDSVTWDGANGSMTGMLTIKDIARPVTLQVSYVGYARDPWDNDRAIFSAHGRVNREDWNLTWNMPLANGGLLVSKEIELEIEVETILEH